MDAPQPSEVGSDPIVRSYLELAKVERQLVWVRRDDKREVLECVESAVRADGSSPAAEFLLAMREGTLAVDDPPIPPDERIYDYERFYEMIRHLGRTGEPKHGDAVRHLREGIWEFRHHDLRLTFWDTTDDGLYTPKYPVSDASVWGTARPKYWKFPSLDAFVRLGCGWQKTGEKAPPEMIEMALRIREEDCAHDRNTPSGGTDPA